MVNSEREEVHERADPEQECRDREAELFVAPAKLPAEKRLHQRQDLPVDVVHGRREEQQRANDPPAPAFALNDTWTPFSRKPRAYHQPPCSRTCFCSE